VRRAALVEHLAKNGQPTKGMLQDQTQLMWLRMISFTQSGMSF
jgi:hypothetical protein